MLVLALAAAALSARVPPVDQCASDPTFAAFRNELRQTIARRDADALVAIVADDAYASFGGHRGKKGFIDKWSLAERPTESEVWAELGEALELGCALRGEVRVAPSFMVQIDGPRDAFETWVALPGAVLRKNPANGSAAIARLKWDVLTVDGDWEGGQWLPVKLDSGRKGYVRTDKARGVLDYRASFRLRGGRWLMTSFVAGD